MRCNLQIEGSGLIPEDVILDGGKNYKSKAPDARPGETVKHVVLRADRADGFVGRNFTMRGSREHGFYTEETDGILLDRVKFFWAADYGHLSFTTDHNMISNCEALGAGDAGVYPGASPETGAQATSFYPDAPRINTVVKKCDLHGNVLAYSGSMGNAVRITKNEIYGNTAGISTDTISASGHPGFPADSVEIDHNNIYANNLDLYGTDTPTVQPIVGVLPVGVGIFWAGHNDGNVHDNYIFDNWRYGAQLLAVPDAAVAALDDFEPEGGVDPGISCPLPGQISTSCNNKFHDNFLGTAPDGFEPSPEVKRFGNVTALPAAVTPNGTDFWWDEFVANPGNCWFDNIGADGTEGSITGPGVGTPPDVLPDETICGGYMGTSDAAKESNLVNCFTARSGGDKAACDWYTMPPQPGSAASRTYQREQADRAKALALSRKGRLIEDNIAELAEPRRRLPAAVSGRRSGAPARLAAAAAILAATATLGCGSDDGAGSEPTADYGAMAALAQCHDWARRDEAERLETIETIRAQINLPDGPVETPSLSDEEAYDLFERACEPAHAKDVRLYIVYSRAAGFSSLLDR